MTPDYTRATAAALRFLDANKAANRFAFAERDPSWHHARAAHALTEIAGEYGYVLAPMPEQEGLREVETQEDQGTEQ